MLDDSPEKLSVNYGNLLKVKPFYGNKNDDELLCVMKYLSFLEKKQNVRMIREVLIDRTNLVDILSLNAKTIKKAREPVPQMALFNPDSSDLAK